MERSRLENFRANKEEIEYLEGKEQTPYYTQRLEDLRIEQAEVEAWIRSIPQQTRSPPLRVTLYRWHVVG